MRRPEEARDIMAGLGALVKSGLVERETALAAVGAFDAVGWKYGVVESRDGKALYRPGMVVVPAKTSRVKVEAKQAEPEKKAGRVKWIPTEAELF